MSHLVTLYDWAERGWVQPNLALPVAELDLRTLEGLLLMGTMVIVFALVLIAANRKKTPYKSL
jgi:hypothetical protein